MINKECGKCKETKPLSAFGKDRATKDGNHRWCKACFNEWHRTHRQIPEVKAHTAEWHRTYNQKPEVKIHRAEQQRTRRQQPAVKAHIVEQQRVYTQRLRFAAFAKLDPHPHCLICSCEELRWLTIDHINGDGAQHRRDMGHKRVYLAIIADPNPKSTYRILCYSCNSLLPLYNNDEQALKAAHQRNNERIGKKWANMNNRIFRTILSFFIQYSISPNTYIK